MLHPDLEPVSRAAQADVQVSEAVAVDVTAEGASAGEGAAAEGADAAAGAAEEGTPIYRGVASNHNAFADAQQGIASPGDVAGHADVYAHNAGDTWTSRLTSWTTDSLWRIRCQGLRLTGRL